MKKQDEIIKYSIIEEYYDAYSCSDVISINIKLDKKNLKLLKELHGNIGLDEFFSELKDKIKEEVK